MSNISIKAEASATSIADSLSRCDAFELIKAIECAQADWDFTEQVAIHFVKAMLEADYGDGDAFREWLRGLEV